MDNSKFDGYLPSEGTITIYELERKWRIKERSLLPKLEAAGIKVVNLQKVKIVNLKDLERLFYEE